MRRSLFWNHWNRINTYGPHVHKPAARHQGNQVLGFSHDESTKAAKTAIMIAPRMGAPPSFCQPIPVYSLTLRPNRKLYHSYSLKRSFPANISTSDQRCNSVVDQRWSDVENETKSDVGFSTLYNIDTTLVHDVETTLKQSW